MLFNKLLNFLNKQIERWQKINANLLLQILNILLQHSKRISRRLSRTRISSPQRLNKIILRLNLTTRRKSLLINLLLSIRQNNPGTRQLRHRRLFVASNLHKNLTNSGHILARTSSNISNNLNHVGQAINTLTRQLRHSHPATHNRVQNLVINTRQVRQALRVLHDLIGRLFYLRSRITKHTRVLRNLLQRLRHRFTLSGSPQRLITKSSRTRSHSRKRSNTRSRETTRSLTQPIQTRLCLADALSIKLGKNIKTDRH